jgi:hypothetical protein
VTASRAPAFLSALVALSACPHVTPRLGYPWIESTDAALVHEELIVSLDDGRATVEARLTLRARRDLAARQLAFPEDDRDAPLEALRATWGGQVVASQPEGRGAVNGFLPLEHVRRWHTLALPPQRRGDQRTLVVCYAQPLTAAASGRVFRYLIRTGAYWYGPIGELVVRVRGIASTLSRVRRARLDGRAPTRRIADELRWDLRAIEPREDLRLDLD